jgi:hypothetical protein
MCYHQKWITVKKLATLENLGMMYPAGHSQRRAAAVPLLIFRVSYRVRIALSEKPALFEQSPVSSSIELFHF